MEGFMVIFNSATDYPVAGKPERKCQMLQLRAPRQLGARKIDLSQNGDDFKSACNEREQVLVNDIGLRCDHSVWVIFVRFQRTVLQELG